MRSYGFQYYYCWRLHLDHKMKETDLYKSYTMQQLLDKLDVFECFENESHKLRIGELLNNQAEIYKTLEVALPTSSSREIRFADFYCSCGRIRFYPA